MSPRPYPTQTRGTDEREARRLHQGWLRAPYAIDEDEQRRQLDEGSTDNGARAARRAALDDWAGAQGKSYVLTPAHQDELFRFLEDKGPRPAFVVPPVAGQYMTTEERNAHDLAVAARAGQGPKQDPTEPGRYVQPQGRFALAGSEGFTPDPR
jgi:hypothetical protein